MPASEEQPQPQASTSAPAASPAYRTRLTTEEWRALYEADGTVDLFLQDGFQAGPRIVVSTRLPAHPHATNRDTSLVAAEVGR